MPYCCETFESQVEYRCKQHPDNCPDQVVIKSKSGYLLQSPNAHYSIRFCPWCGAEVGNVGHWRGGGQQDPTEDHQGALTNP